MLCIEPVYIKLSQCLILTGKVPRLHGNVKHKYQPSLRYIRQRSVFHKTVEASLSCGWNI